MFFRKIHVRVSREIVTLRDKGREIELAPVLHVDPGSLKVVSVGFQDLTESEASQAGLRTVYLFEPTDTELCKGRLMEAFFRYALARIFKGHWNFLPPEVEIDIDPEISDYFRGYAPALFHFLVEESGAKRTNFSKTFGDMT